MPHWGEGANFGEKGGGNLVGEDASAAPDSKGKSLQNVDGLIKILYISEENADEGPKIRVSLKDEGGRMKGKLGRK